MYPESSRPNERNFLSLAVAGKISFDVEGVGVSSSERVGSDSIENIFHHFSSSSLDSMVKSFPYLSLRMLVLVGTDRRGTFPEYSYSLF